MGRWTTRLQAKDCLMCMLFHNPKQHHLHISPIFCCIIFCRQPKKVALNSLFVAWQDTRAKKIAAAAAAAPGLPLEKPKAPQRTPKRKSRLHRNCERRSPRNQRPKREGKGKGGKAKEQVLGCCCLWAPVKKKHQALQKGLYGLGPAKGTVFFFNTRPCKRALDF